jgi:outer membrane lipoprotein SlyB
MNIPKLTTLSLCLVMLLGGCAKEIDADLYTEENFGEASHTYQGVIVNVRKVRMQQGDKLEDNKTGIAVGAITGAVVGNQFGKGSGNVASTAIGGLGGAFLGSLAEKKLKSQDALEYVVKLSNGDVRSIVQGLSPSFSVGQRVLVMINRHNRSRIIADNS